ncbi:MAG: MaoC family dehydratase [Minwuia sp.]|uniref:MaoC family dehydratase n=1 Tax=Minwuia sp. TaxID=2493630 RepID=UPI003A860FA4
MRATTYFDDYALGDRYVTDSVTVTEGQILRFAREYDTQLFHTNVAAADESHFGGLIGSGFQTLNLSFALFFKLQLVQPAAVGGAGIDGLRWRKPLRPGDTIHVECEVIDLVPSASRPDRGTVRMRHDTFNQDGDVIMTLECLHILQTRAGAAAS